MFAKEIVLSWDWKEKKVGHEAMVFKMYRASLFGRERPESSLSEARYFLVWHSRHTKLYLKKKKKVWSMYEAHVLRSFETRISVGLIMSADHVFRAWWMSGGNAADPGEAAKHIRPAFHSSRGFRLNQCELCFTIYRYTRFFFLHHCNRRTWSKKVH